MTTHQPLNRVPDLCHVYIQASDDDDIDDDDDDDVDIKSSSI